MPIYEFVCPSCERQFDLMRPFSRADEGASCPSCHKSARRKVSVFASFSKSSTGQSTPIAGTGGGCSCGSCGGGSCGTCGG